MKKTALLLMVITLLSKFFGLLRDVTLAYFYGASTISDAYLIALTISSVIFGFIATGISTGYIPIYRQIEENDGKNQAFIFTNNLLNIVLLMATLIIIIGFLFTEELVNIFALGFEGETLILAVKFTKISLIGIYFSSLVYLFSAFLQLNNSYLIPALIGFPMNIILIATIYSSSFYNIYILIIGAVLAVFSQFLFLFPFVLKKGLNYRPVFNIKDKNIIRLSQIVAPVMIGVSINQINVLVDKTVASSLVIGGISALDYANRLNLLVQGIFVVSITTVMYPLISKMAAEKNLEGIKKTVAESMGSINILIIPASIGAMFFSEPIIQLLFGRGAFDQQAVDMTSNALFFYAIGMTGYGQREVLARAFYSMQDTRTPIVNAAITVVINIFLILVLSKYLGLGGLALGTSISAIVGSLLLLKSLRKKIGGLGMKDIVISFIKIFVSSLIMGKSAREIYEFLVGIVNPSFALITSIFFGILIYLILIYLLKLKELNNIVNKFSKK